MADKKKHSTKRGKFLALITSVLMVLATLAYIVCGEDLAVAIGTFDYSKLVGYFTAEPPEGQIEIHVIDVGQGDSILVRTPDGDILIDSGTGSSKEELKAHLVACGVDSLAYFICTHPHEDHIGGADMIIESFDIGTLLMPDYTATTYVFERLLTAIEAYDVVVEAPEAGDSYTLGDVEFRVLAPVYPSDDANDMSLVIRLTFGETSFLFTGDAESPSEEEMLTAYFPFELDSDFLKLGHHGSNTSTSEEFLSTVSPDVVAVSCGRDNDYGHPHREVLERLSAIGIDKLYRTDTMGSLVFVSDGTNISTYE